MPAARRRKIVVGWKDVDRHRPDVADEPVDHGAVAQLKPPGPARLADDDLGRVRIGGEASQTLDNIFRRNAGCRRAQSRCQRQRIGQRLALLVGKGLRAPGFDMHCGPGRLERIGEAFGSADQTRRARLLADGDHDALAHREASRQRVGADIIEHLRIDRLRGTAQRQFAQGGQVGLGEKMGERPRRLCRDIDLAFLEPFDQLVGQYIDDLDLRGFQNGIGHGFAHAHMGEGCDDVVQALYVLDIDRRIDVDTGVEQFLDVLIAFGVTAARCIAVRQFVDQGELWLPFEDGIQIHFAKADPPMVDLPPWYHFMTRDQRFGLAPAMRLDNANHDIDAGLEPPHPVAEHLVSLADARRRAEEQLETAASFLRGCAQEGLWRRAFVGVVHCAVVALIRSSRRLRSRMLTLGSPRKPRNGVLIVSCTRARTRAAGRPRTAATRAT